MKENQSNRKSYNGARGSVGGRKGKGVSKVEGARVTNERNWE